LLKFLFVVEIFTKHGRGLLLFAAPCTSSRITVGNRAYRYAELAVSSLTMAVTIASTHFPTRGGDGLPRNMSWSLSSWFVTPS